MPEPESAAASAGPSTATPSARRRAARSKAPGRPWVAAPVAAAGLGAVDWAKSWPALGRGMAAAMTLPSPSMAATQ